MLSRRVYKESEQTKADNTDHPLTMLDQRLLAVAAAVLALLAYYVGGASSITSTTTPTTQAPLASHTPANTSAALNFGPLIFAGHANWIYRDDVTAAQVVISE
jgi:hypothetical protein